MKNTIKPLISIIMPSYNLESYIENTINSVLNQTYLNWEFIIVDDASSDNSVDIIKKYLNDNRIKLISFENNMGMSTALNIGINNSKGEYIARIDADDMWHENKLEVQIEFMEQNCDIGASFTWVNIIDENGNEVPSNLCENRDKVYNSFNRSREEWIRTFYFDGCLVCHPTAVIRKSVLDEVGCYNCNYRQIQDYDLWINILKKHSIHVIESPLISYRWFLENKTNTSSYSHKTYIRGAYEVFSIMSNFHFGLEDDIFYKTFKRDFFNQSALSHDQLLCERALIMYHKKTAFNRENKIIGLKMMEDLFINEETRKVLYNDYAIDINTYYEWTSYPLLIQEAYMVNIENPKYPKINAILKKIYSFFR